MASTSNYASTPNVGSAVITAALGGTRAVPTGASTLITAGASGSVITRALIQNVQASADAASSVNVAAFYIHNGTTYFLVKEVALASQDPSAAAACVDTDVPFNDLVLPSGWTLQVGIRVRTSSVDDTCITAFAGNF